MSRTKGSRSENYCIKHLICNLKFRFHKLFWSNTFVLMKSFAILYWTCHGNQLQLLLCLYYDGGFHVFVPSSVDLSGAWYFCYGGSYEVPNQLNEKVFQNRIFGIDSLQCSCIIYRYRGKWFYQMAGRGTNKLSAG